MQVDMLHGRFGPVRFETRGIVVDGPAFFSKGVRSKSLHSSRDSLLKLSSSSSNISITSYDSQNVVHINPKSVDISAKKLNIFSGGKLVYSIENGKFTIAQDTLRINSKSPLVSLFTNPRKCLSHTILSLSSCRSIWIQVDKISRNTFSSRRFF
jgi:hypothetical protein